MERIEDCIDFIKSKPKPLAVYVFTNNDGLKDKMESEISAGSIVFNDAIIQVSSSVTIIFVYVSDLIRYY